MTDDHLCPGNWDSLVFSNRKCSEISTIYREEGNALYVQTHDPNTHMQVLSLYSTSIALAPENSEELAFGYGNRSAILLHIEKYEESIADIDKALLISNSDKLKAKLSSRRSTCLKFINELKNNPKQDPETDMDFQTLELPNITSSKKVSHVSESLSLEYNQRHGKHMRANRDIEPGEIVAIEEAYVSAPETNKLFLVCSHCLSQIWNGIPCKFCTITMYCSDKCKNQAWQEYHDMECSIISEPCIIGHILSRMTVRFFIKLIRKFGLKNIIQEVQRSGKS